MQKIENIQEYIKNIFLPSKIQNINCLYIFNPKTSSHFKIGESHTGFFSRGLTNDYYTAQGYDGDFYVFFTDNKCDIKKCENKLLNFCKNYVINGNAGKEVFTYNNNDENWNNIDSVFLTILEFIDKNLPIFSSYFISSVLNFRKNFNNKEYIKNIIDFNKYDINIINNGIAKCILCNREMSKKIYRIYLQEDNIEIDIGETCYKNILGKRLVNIKYQEKELENYYTSDNIDDNSEHDLEYELDYDSYSESDYSEREEDLEENKPLSIMIFDIFLERYMINSDKIKVIELDYSYENYKYCILEKHILFLTLKILFNICKKGDCLIDKLTDEINKIIYNKNTDSIYSKIDKYFILNIINKNNEIFVIEDNNIILNYNKFNLEYIISEIQNYINSKCQEIDGNHSKLWRTEGVELNTTNFENKIIVGDPGTGKSSHVAELLISNNSAYNIIITPTHSTKENLRDKIYELYKENYRSKNDEKRKSEKYFVISEFNNKYTSYLITKYIPLILGIKNKKNKTITNKIYNKLNIICDEFSMYSIVDWLRIINLFKIIRTSGLHIDVSINVLFTGDPYQIPPISFTNETLLLLRFLYNNSTKLTKNNRAKEGNEVFKYAISNKEEFNLEDFIKNYKNKGLILETKKIDLEYIKKIYHLYKNHKFITSTNKYKDNINKIFFDIEKKCKKCPNSIKNNKDFSCCDKCISNFKFRCETNIKFKKYKIYKDNDTTEICLSIGNEDFSITEKLYNILDKTNTNNGVYETNYIEQLDNIRKLIIKEGLDYLILDLEYTNKDGKVIKEINLLKNNYDNNLLIYNGQIFNIKTINKNIITVNSRGNEIKIYRQYFDKYILNNLVLTYAETVNKSQGNTYDKCIFLIGDIDKLNSSNMFVALTRAKHETKILLLKNKEVTIEKNSFCLEQNITEKKYNKKTDIGNTIINIGKNKGQTFKQLADSNPSYYYNYIIKKNKQLTGQLKDIKEYMESYYKSISVYEILENLYNIIEKDLHNSYNKIAEMYENISDNIPEQLNNIIYSEIKDIENKLYE